MIEIISLGSWLSLQDSGRPGWRRFGLPAGGAMDQSAMALANELLGNPHNAPVLEIAQLGAQLCILQDTWLALAGADTCSSLQSGSALPVRAGERLCFDQKSAGLYAYLAVAGGFQTDKWLGSASTDLRNGMGRRLQKGDHLQAQTAHPKAPIDRVARRVSMLSQGYIPAGQAHFDLFPGPQYDDFSTQARQQFIQTEWTVSNSCDRTGYRLEGEPLQVPASIPSEPVLPGSFQVPGGGQPIITMADGPTVGGYAKIAVMRAEDLDRLAQCAPSTKLSFAWID